MSSSRQINIKERSFNKTIFRKKNIVEKSILSELNSMPN